MDGCLQEAKLYFVVSSVNLVSYAAVLVLSRNTPQSQCVADLSVGLSACLCLVSCLTSVFLSVCLSVF